MSNEGVDDLVTDCINKGIKRFISSLNQLVGCNGDMTSGNTLWDSIVTNIMVSNGNLIKCGIENESNVSKISVEFNGKFSGTTSLLITRENSQNIIEILNDASLAELDDETRVSTLHEVANIRCNHVVGTLSNAVNETLSFSAPSFVSGQGSQLLKLSDLDLKNKTLICNMGFPLIGKKNFLVMLIQFNGPSWDELLFCFQQVTK